MCCVQVSLGVSDLRVTRAKTDKQTSGLSDADFVANVSECSDPSSDFFFLIVTEKRLAENLVTFSASLGNICRL